MFSLFAPSVAQWQSLGERLSDACPAENGQEIAVPESDIDDFKTYFLDEKENYALLRSKENPHQ